MKARARALGHPIHPMLIAFPLGLFPVAVIFDVLYWYGKNARWAEISFWLIAAGIIGGLLAAVFGFADWLKIPAGTRAKAIGLLHGVLNVVVVGLFGISWLLRRSDPGSPGGLEITLGIIAIVLALLSGWLGGELVFRLNIGVDEGAHPDSPSSLSNRPATEREHGGRGAR
jgi:uncharacterized membrane protein